MAGLLGYASINNNVEKKLSRAYIRIQYWIAFYPGAVEALDNAPRPAHYIKKFEEIQSKASDLLNELFEMDLFLHAD